MKIHKTIIILFAMFAAMSTFCSGNDIASKDVVQGKIKAGAIIVDVRTPAEFAQWNYPGSINIPLDQIKARINEFGPKDKPVVLYCRSGNRSSQAKKILIENGFKDVTNAGGLSEMKGL